MKSPNNEESILRLPPHSTEAEGALLGCILLSPDSCLVECVQKNKAGEKLFYDLRHQTLYRALVEMWDEMEPIDLITLRQWLSDRQQIDAVGGLGYISGLSDAVPSAANMQYYLDIVTEKYRLRKMVQTCTDIVGRIYDQDGDVEEILDRAETEVLKLSQERVTLSTPPIKELVGRAITTIEQYHQNKGILNGIATGFSDFDKMTTGLHGGEMIVIAARPSIGKTSLAMNIAEHAALESNIPVGVFSLEMSADSLTLRMLCSRARVNLRDIRDGFLSERDFPKLTGAAGKISKAPLFIDDSAGLTILELRAKARQMWQQYGIKLFVIDYLQLLHSTSRKAESRQQEVAEISSGVKALSKELNVPIIVLAQLNREAENRGLGSRPKMSDLRESGQIEADADLIGLLYIETSKEQDEMQNEANADSLSVKLLIAKQRNGPTGTIDLTFLRNFTRFESAAKVALEDVPYKSPHND
jgi:replicative DNA helicase